jgi:hypothetical protein
MLGAGIGAGLHPTFLHSILSRAPAALRLAHLDCIAEGPFPRRASQVTLGSASRGTREVLAHDGVHLLFAVNMEGDPVELRRGALRPFATRGDVATLGTVVARTLASAEPIHAGDPDPPRIFALDGSVCPYRLGSCVPALRSLAVQVNLAKPSDLFAGRTSWKGTIGSAGTRRTRSPGRTAHDG